MMHPRRDLTGALVAIAALAIGACAGAPRERPLQTGPIETGAGSLNDTRKALEGTWKLASLEVVDHGARRPIKAGGDLTYDRFGNMTVRGVIEDPGLKETLVIDYSGRITIDVVRHEFYPADLVTDRPVDQSQVMRISPDKVRRYELSGNEFVVTYLDASATPTAVITWRR
jgi:hypothetical protein